MLSLPLFEMHIRKMFRNSNFICKDRAKSPPRIHVVLKILEFTRKIGYTKFMYYYTHLNINTLTHMVFVILLLGTQGI